MQKMLKLKNFTNVTDPTEHSPLWWKPAQAPNANENVERELITTSEHNPILKIKRG